MAEGHACDGGGGGQVVGLDQGMAEQVPGLYAAPLARDHEEGLGGVGHHGCSVAHYSLHVVKAQIIYDSALQFVHNATNASDEEA